jgi:hypothetical protein
LLELTCNLCGEVATLAPSELMVATDEMVYGYFCENCQRVSRTIMPASDQSTELLMQLVNNGAQLVLNNFKQFTCPLCKKPFQLDVLSELKLFVSTDPAEYDYMIYFCDGKCQCERVCFLTDNDGAELVANLRRHPIWEEEWVPLADYGELADDEFQAIIDAILNDKLHIERILSGWAAEMGEI